MLYPLTFEPIYKERLWGGRKLEALYGKVLPANLPIGESWEISDRPGDSSVINRGALAGRNLHWLVQEHPTELLGAVPPIEGRFPLLAKILDANQTLSLQVHPPALAARELEGEPKTEIWYLAQADPGAELFVGLKRGTSREEFARRLSEGTVADCFHRLPVRAGDAMFVPSGRVHGIGAGCVIFELQQNSDTTYRVFDWNRTGLDGKPRPLHIPESLASIDFNDFEPSLVGGDFAGEPGCRVRPLVDCPFFKIEARRFEHGTTLERGGQLLVVAVTGGELSVKSQSDVLVLKAGQFCLLPAGLEKVGLGTETTAHCLIIEPK